MCLKNKFMFCKECGAEVDDDVKFCPECGKSLSDSVKDEKPIVEKNNADKPKSMGIALIISIILSGLGVAYAGNTKKGVIIFILSIIGFLISSGIGIVIWIYGLYATYIEVNHTDNAENAGFIEKIRVLSTPKKIVLLLVFLVVISGVAGFVLTIFGDSDSDSNDSIGTLVENTMDDTELSESEFKELCEPIDYKQLTKNSAKYMGNRTVVSGEVLQIMEENDGGLIRLATTDGYDDVVAVVYSGTNDVVEGDTITVYGYIVEDYSYTSQANFQITIPCVDAKYIDES